jgi:DNA-directed RNA polymerase specialized sigma54-like protein
MDKASESILALKPVTFRYTSDSTKTAQFGLIAEDVEKINPDLVVRDKNGEIYTVRYDAVNAMLLNEFLKEHRKVENLKNDFQTTVAQQQKDIAMLIATVKQQAAEIQKVSAQLAAASPSRGGPAPQVVNNPLTSARSN